MFLLSTIKNYNTKKKADIVHWVLSEHWALFPIWPRCCPFIPFRVACRSLCTLGIPSLPALPCTATDRRQPLPCARRLPALLYPLCPCPLALIFFFVHMHSPPFHH